MTVATGSEMVFLNTTLFACAEYPAKFNYQRHRTITQLTFLKIHWLLFREGFPSNTFCGIKKLGASVTLDLIFHSTTAGALGHSHHVTKGTIGRSLVVLCRISKKSLVLAFVGHVPYISKLWVRVRILCSTYPRDLRELSLLS